MWKKPMRQLMKTKIAIQSLAFSKRISANRISSFMTSKNKVSLKDSSFQWFLQVSKRIKWRNSLRSFDYESVDENQKKKICQNLSNRHSNLNGTNRNTAPPPIASFHKTVLTNSFLQLVDTTFLISESSSSMIFWMRSRHRGLTYRYCYRLSPISRSLSCRMSKRPKPMSILTPSLPQAALQTRTDA